MVRRAIFWRGRRAAAAAMVGLALLCCAGPVAANKAQETMDAYSRAQALIGEKKFGDALGVLEPLSKEYPGQWEFLLGTAECLFGLQRPANAFMKAIEMDRIIQSLIVNPGRSKDDVNEATVIHAETDGLLMRAITSLAELLPGDHESLLNAKARRAKSLHSAALGMLSTRTTSGWGRRVLAQSHSAMVDARNTGEETGSGGCKRTILWGWDTSKHIKGVRITRIALPVAINIAATPPTLPEAGRRHSTTGDGLTHRGTEAYTPKYTIGPVGSPVFRNMFSQPQSQSQSTPRFFTDIATTFFVHMVDVYLDAHVGEQVWGVYYNDCTVFSTSKLHNTIINQAYVGAADETIVIDTPVISIVYASLQNYYHVMIETMPKLLLLESELRHGHQFPWLTEAPFGPNTPILAPDMPLVRKMIDLIGIDQSRVRYITAKEGTRYLLKTCIMIEFGSPPGVYTNASLPGSPQGPAIKEPKPTVVKYPKALAKVKGVPADSADAWDGIQHLGADLWSVYRTPKQALMLLRSAFPAVWDARPHTIPPPDSVVVKVVYTSRGKKGARSVQGLGEKALLDALRKAFASNTTVLVKHTGRETIEQQRKIFADANVIVGPHGAGLTNMIFMPTGSAVIKFPMLPEIERCFEYMAAALDLTYSEVPGLASHHAGHYVLDKTTLAATVHVVSEAVGLQRTLMDKKRLLVRPTAIVPLLSDGLRQRWPPSTPLSRAPSKAKPAGTAVPPSDVIDGPFRPGAAKDGVADTAARSTREGKGGGTHLDSGATAATASVGNNLKDVLTGEEFAPRTTFGGGDGGGSGGITDLVASRRILALEGMLSREKASHAESVRARDAALEKVRNLTDQNIQLLRRQQRRIMEEL